MLEAGDSNWIQPMDRFAILNDPAWNALNSDHRDLGQLSGFAARYRRELSPLGGLGRYTPEAFGELAALVPEGDAVGLVSTADYGLPQDWELMQTVMVEQMVCLDPPGAPPLQPVQLTEADVPQMVELARATEPGPFRAGTIGMGRYFGFKTEDGRLMSMAGERMRLDGLTEVSGVCTWPEFRGKGLAKALVAAVSAMIAAEGRVPFLHVKTENAGAIALYDGLGFRVRSRLAFKVMRPRRGEGS